MSLDEYLMLAQSNVLVLFSNLSDLWRASQQNLSIRLLSCQGFTSCTVLDDIQHYKHIYNSRFPARLLQFSTLWNIRFLYKEAAENTECSCTGYHRNQKIRFHHTFTNKVKLAPNCFSDQLQDSNVNFHNMLLSTATIPCNAHQFYLREQNYEAPKAHFVMTNISRRGMLVDLIEECWSSHMELPSTEPTSVQKLTCTKYVRTSSHSANQTRSHHKPVYD